MSWTVNPGMLIGPIDSTFDYHFGVSQQRMSPVLIGAGADAGRFCYMPAEGDEALDVYTVSEQISYSIQIGADVLQRQPGLVHDKAWFASPSGYGTWILYYHPTAGVYGHGAYVLISWAAQPGYLPAEYQDPDTGDWLGDTWWSGPIPTPGTSLADTTLVPRGLDKDTGSNKTAEFHWPRWIKDGSPGGGEIDLPAGTYTPVSGSGVSGTVTVGLPVWRDATNTDYIRSRLKTSGKYTYGAISYDATPGVEAWVIGTPGDEAGWWVGDEPSLTSAKTFAFTVPEGSEVTGDDIVVTFDRYTLGTDKTQRWLAEAGVIR